jgi:hypothetical protein
MDVTPSLRELEHLYAWLRPEERAGLLQCLLVAAPRGGQATMEVIGQTLLCHSTDDLLDEMGEGRSLAGA